MLHIRISLFNMVNTGLSAKKYVSHLVDFAKVRVQLSFYQIEIVRQDVDCNGQ